MSFPSFSDIDKTIKDLLSKEFFNAKKAPYVVKTKTAGPFGSKLTSTNDIQDGNLTPTLSAEYNGGSGFAVDKLEVSGKGTKVETSLEGGAIPPGFKLEFKGDDKSAGELGVTYETDAFTAEATFDIINQSTASVAVCSGSGATTFGADAAIGFEGSPSLSSYSVGVAHKVPGTCSGAVVVNNKAEATATFGYSGLADFNLGAQFEYPTNSLSFGGAYTCNKNTTMKVKAGTDGVLAASVKQTLAPKTVLVGMLSVSKDNTTPSFGASLTVG